MADDDTLAGLRGQIDSIDREVLQLLAKRLAVVDRIARWKREHGVRIRDHARERSLLSERRELASALGLKPQTVESIYRLVLLSSREQQAAQQTELPVGAASKVVGIIGGKGGMGVLFARVFTELGNRVLVSDVGTQLTNEQLAREADVVVISVPIERTLEVVRAVGPQVRAEALLCDLTSLKAAPLAAMLKSTSASVVGLHPMFGPTVHSLQGQRVVVCPGRGDEWLGWLGGMLSARGLVLAQTNPEQHDRVMAAVQVLTHFKTQVTALTLSRLGVSLEQTLAFTSPAYLMDLYVEGRHFAQSPDLYGPIEMLNPLKREVTGLFEQAAREVAGLLERDDQPGFRAMFEEVRRFFGAFTHEALEQSAFLIDRLVERS
jgi:chorismate mutase/prephenate dehydrogenase